MAKLLGKLKLPKLALPRFRKRGAEVEDEDDDLDLDLDDDDELAATGTDAAEQAGEAFDENQMVGGGPVIEDRPSDDLDAEAPADDLAVAEAAQAGELDADAAEGDEPPIRPGVDDDLDLDEDDLDDEDFDEDEEEGASLSERLEELGDNRAVLFSLIGVLFLVVFGALGGGAWWILSGDDAKTAADALPAVSEDGSGVSIVLDAPGSGGPGDGGGEGLNQFAGGGGGLEPPANGGAAAADEADPGIAAVESDDATEPPQEEQSFASLNQMGSGAGLNALATDSATGTIVMASTQAAYNRFPDLPDAEPLPEAPLAELVEVRGQDIPLLPQVSGDKKPWEVYARPSDVPDDVKQVALIVTDLGLSQAATFAAIRKLPPEVTLAFNSYGDGLEEWLIRARRAGHETLVMLPLEGNRYPIEDPGPMGLLTSASKGENLKRLQDVLGSFQGYVGIFAMEGLKFASSEEHMRPILKFTNDRGLMYVDGTLSPRSVGPQIARLTNMPLVVTDVRLDEDLSSAEVQRSIEQANAVMDEKNFVVVETSLNPMIMERLQDWFTYLVARRARLVPVSALADRQPVS